MTVNGFVKHPPIGVDIDLSNPPNLLVTEVEVAATMENGVAIMICKADTPVHAIESIVLCHDAGLYPPLSAMDWLVGALKIWHESGGKISMDKAMKLKASGQTGNAMREALREEHEQKVMARLNYLRSNFDITNRDAAAMVEAMLAETDWNRSGHKLTAYSADTLVDILERKWAKIYAGHAHLMKPASENEKRETLTHYPRHSWEHLPQMKAYL